MELKNYHQVNTCKNCEFHFDSGVDEEYLECEHKYYKLISKERIHVESDYVCDFYLLEK